MAPEKFNPYDLNNIADIDKFIKQWEEKKLRTLSQKLHRRPTTGLLKKTTVTQPGNNNSNSSKP